MKVIITGLLLIGSISSFAKDYGCLPNLISETSVEDMKRVGDLKECTTMELMYLGETYRTLTFKNSFKERVLTCEEALTRDVDEDVLSTCRDYERYNGPLFLSRDNVSYYRHTEDVLLRVNNWLKGQSAKQMAKKECKDWAAREGLSGSCKHLSTENVKLSVLGKKVLQKRSYYIFVNDDIESRISLSKRIDEVY